MDWDIVATFERFATNLGGEVHLVPRSRHTPQRDSRAAASVRQKKSLRPSKNEETCGMSSAVMLADTLGEPFSFLKTGCIFSGDAKHAFRAFTRALAGLAAWMVAAAAFSTVKRTVPRAVHLATLLQSFVHGAGIGGAHFGR